jgi:MFS family permease
MMPGALVSGLMMPLSGQLYDRIGPRPLVVAGLALLAFLTYTFHNLSVVTPVTTVMVWIMLRGLVMSFANMPAQTASIAVIPQELVGRASALTNIISRVASSFGLAVLTSIMTNRTALHTAQLAASVTPQNLAFSQLMQKAGSLLGGGAGGHAAALSVVYGEVQELGYVQGIDDIFIVAAGLTVFAIIPALFLKRATQPAGRNAPAHR